MKPLILLFYLTCVSLLWTNVIFTQVEFTLSHDGLERTYLLDLPDGDVADLPLVLVLHGYVSSAQIIRGYSGWSSIADAGHAVICYPQGTADNLGVNHWNANLGISETDDIGFLTSLVETLQETYGLKEECTFSCGMSNGGFMSYTLACERPDLFRAVGSVTGNMSAFDQLNCNPVNILPIIHLHGTFDPTVSYNQGVILDGPWSGGWGVEEVMEYWSELMGTEEVTEEPVPNTVLLDLTTVDFIRHFDAPNGQEFHHYRVNGGLHDWFGAWGNQDIDSTELLWEFFTSVCAQSANNIAAIPPQSLPRFIVRTTDMMGRSVPNGVSGVLLYQYSDGTVEKRVRVIR
jgi:polyhydroxybutyrate depolymerase